MISSYREALEYLYGLTNYEIKSQFAYAPQFFDLERVRRLLAELGSPQERFRSVHVAGTKGKGSTSAMLASVLESAGYCTGLYTSPHLHSFRERMQVNGALIPRDQFVSLTQQVRPLADRDLELTTFEVATAVAFAYFAREGVDIAVVEVGLGGRLDATNVIQPLVSVLTTIGHDHMHILGDTLAEIAAEKAGIVKEGIPVVTAPQPPAALQVIRRACEERRAPLHEVSRLWRWMATSWNLKGQECTLAGRPSAGPQRPRYKRLFVPLLGTHQLRNAAVALTALQGLVQSGLTISEEAIRGGLRNVVWPGRFEILGERPYFIVDGAHNVDSARSLARTVHKYFAGYKPWYILAILRDKDIPAILRHLLPSAAGVIFSRSHHPRAADPRELRDAARSAIPMEVVPDLGEATERALLHAGTSGMIVGTGSVTTAGEVREKWLRLRAQELPPLDPVTA